MFRKKGGLFCCPVFDEIRGQNPANMAGGRLSSSSAADRTRPHSTVAILPGQIEIAAILLGLPEVFRPFQSLAPNRLGDRLVSTDRLTEVVG